MRKSPCACRAPRARSNPFLREFRLGRVGSRGLREAEPVVLSGEGGARCEPFLRVEKDPNKFAACNALADQIGPLREPKKVFEFLEGYLGNSPNEVFGVLTVDIHGRVKGYTETGRGEASSVMAPVIPTVRAALLGGGEGAILFHCHPSGTEAEPSDADIETTEAFAEAFETVNMPLIDHIIVGGDARRRSYYSFKEDGYL